ncbi:MAG: VWA domain-containing protein [Acidobacteria bacterium]|nr:MAG: VWA domain-containing protein [Acidobacteriota bacterium]REK02443.1 MAG: VWA domain-containing protein [Acidobacteriota bacterium]REK13756.1 MAG: VWA domain-containing protein [Acidobacteriota bacterium]REK41750.1 MAG: VWA domain-containing protein [Acidobacteriota bacterium]
MKKTIIAVAIAAVFLTGVYVQAQTIGRPRVVEKKDDTPAEPLAPPPPLVVDDDEVLKIETNLVTLPVSVLDERGRFISDLGVDDFQIYEDGVKQEIEFFRSVEQPFTVVLLLDLSPSTKYKINEIQDAAISFVDQLRQDDEIIVVTFSRDVQVISRQKSNYHRFRRAIREAKFGDGTSIYQAVAYAMKEELRLIDGRKALVIFSDGVDTSSRGANYDGTLRDAEALDSLVYPIWYNTFQEGKATKDAAGDVIYPTGASPEENERGKNYLRDLTEFAGGKLYEANDIENLNFAFRSIAEELRKQYYIGYYPQLEGKLGERKKINVRVRRPRLTVRSKNSYRVNF